MRKCDWKYRAKVAEKNERLLRESIRFWYLNHSRTLTERNNARTVAVRLEQELAHRDAAGQPVGVTPGVVLECPGCGEHLTVPISSRVVGASDAEQYLACEPDLADVWAHAWACTELRPEG